MNSLKRITKTLAAFAVNAGFDPRRVFYLRNLPKYLVQYFQFIKLGGSSQSKIYIYPMLTEFSSQAGSATGHYFHQDLLVASFIYEASPNRHVDIGSSVNGFVAHVASFRKIEMMDVRDLEIIGHKNIVFYKADLMDQNKVQDNICDSISCLHAIEHFGLGRYGDQLDPLGHIKGFNNILRMLKTGGTLYISFPIGNETVTFFNAHRVFAQNDILNWIDPKFELDLIRFDYVDDNGNLHLRHDLKQVIPNLTFGCGIYSFRKTR